MTKAIESTMLFLKEKFLINEGDQKYRYRYEHTLRVAAIGQQIAIKEGLNVEALVLGCLLHDIGYIQCNTEEDFNYHGRISARIAREFLESIQYSNEWIDTICFGIYIHTEEKPEREPTPLEASIADADNIDRFDAYRLYENLKYSAIEEMSQDEIAKMSMKRIARLEELMNYPFGTATGKEMWKDKLEFQKSYYKRLLSQMELTIN